MYTTLKAAVQASRWGRQRASHEPVLTGWQFPQQRDPMFPASLVIDAVNALFMADGLIVAAGIHSNPVSCLILSLLLSHPQLATAHPQAW